MLELEEINKLIVIIMSKIKEWFMHLSFDAFFGVLMILGVFTALLNNVIPTATITYVFDTILTLVILLGVGGMIYKGIKNLFRRNG